VSRPIGGTQVSRYSDLRFYIRTNFRSPQPVLIRALFGMSPCSSVPYSSVRGNGALGPRAVVIEDEFSTMTDEDYGAALNAWLAELDAADAILVPVSAADTLRGEHGER
jgi:hypothetical protein